MALLDDKKDMYLTLVKQAVEKKFQGAVELVQKDDATYLYALHVTPADGERIIRFDTQQCCWVEMEDSFEVCINIVYDGKVFVCYPQEDEDDEGMFFKVEHPQEAAELLHLFVHPEACLAPLEEGECYRTHKLGDLFDVRVLFPFGGAWRMLDPAAMPAGADEEFCRLLHINLTRNWNGLTSGGALPPARFEERWPEPVQGLPDALAALQEGYIMDFEGSIRPGLTEAAEGPTGRYCFFDLLLMPKGEDISRLYLRELLTGHLPYRKALKAAIQEPGSLTAMIDELKDIQLLLPPRYHHQVKRAAEQQVMREWMLHIAESVAFQPGVFYSRVEKNWHLGQVLTGMLIEASACG